MFGECLALRCQQGNVAQITKTIAAVARVAALKGDAARAAQLWGAVEGIRAAHEVAPPTDEDGEEEQRTVALVQATLGTTSASDARTFGRSLTLSQAIDLAWETIKGIQTMPGRHEAVNVRPGRVFTRPPCQGPEAGRQQ